jgi:riboflavin kinase/FMN adenylyltransferase
MSFERPLHLDDHVHAASLAPDLSAGAVVVIGNFDGVHRGHQALVVRAGVEAKRLGLVPVSLTFDPHPSLVLGRPGALGRDAKGMRMLTTLGRRAELLARLGAAHVFVRRFDTRFAAWTPERFVEELLVGEIQAKVVVCGKNFRFGKDRKGDARLLADLSSVFGFAAIADETEDARGPLSSTRAREALERGDLAEAESILGRRHAIEGNVLLGDQRGRTLGFPTANLDATRAVLPPNGVYAVVVDLVTEAGPRALARGVMNIGVRPTVSSEGARSVEVHLFDTDQDLYDQTLRAHVVQKLRDEQRFANLDALKAQIALDATMARATTEAIGPTSTNSYG